MATHPKVAPGASTRTGVPMPSAPVKGTVFLDYQHCQQLCLYRLIRTWKCLPPPVDDAIYSDLKKRSQDKFISELEKGSAMIWEETLTSPFLGNWRQKKIIKIEMATPESSAADKTSKFNREPLIVFSNIARDQLTVVLGPPGEMTPRKLWYQRNLTKFWNDVRQTFESNIGKGSQQDFERDHVRFERVTGAEWVNLRPRNIVDGGSGRNETGSIEDDGPGIIYQYNNPKMSSPTCWRKRLYMLEMNTSSSWELRIFERISLDIFDEAIGESFAQWPSNNRSDGADEEKEDKRTYTSPIEDHGQCKRNLEYALECLALWEHETGTDDTPL